LQSHPRAGIFVDVLEAEADVDDGDADVVFARTCERCSDGSRT
jgi:hypothetical protein